MTEPWGRLQEESNIVCEKEFQKHCRKRYLEKLDKEILQIQDKLKKFNITPTCLAPFISHATADPQVYAQMTWDLEVFLRVKS